ncbi:MAG: hypothetical protein AAGF11_43100 [Myxococcota bacterium]
MGGLRRSRAHGRNGLGTWDGEGRHWQITLSNISGHIPRGL